MSPLHHDKNVRQALIVQPHVAPVEEVRLAVHLRKLVVQEVAQPLLLIVALGNVHPPFSFARSDAEAGAFARHAELGLGPPGCGRASSARLVGGRRVCESLSFTSSAATHRPGGGPAGRPWFKALSRRSVIL